MARTRARCWRALTAVMLAAGLWAALCPFLAGCAAEAIPPSSPMPDGRLTTPPAGWTDYCSRNPEADRCAGAIPT